MGFSLNGDEFGADGEWVPDVFDEPIAPESDHLRPPDPERDVASPQSFLKEPNL